MEPYDPVHLTFEVSRIHLETLINSGFIIRDFHIFKLMTRTVMMFSGYTYGDSYWEAQTSIERHSEIWNRGAYQFVVTYGEAWNACLLTFWHVGSQRCQSEQFYTFQIKHTRDKVRENILRQKITKFLQDFQSHWFPASVPTTTTTTSTASTSTQSSSEP